MLRSQDLGEVDVFYRRISIFMRVTINMISYNKENSLNGSLA